MGARSACACCAATIGELVCDGATSASGKWASNAALAALYSQRSGADAGPCWGATANAGHRGSWSRGWPCAFPSCGLSECACSPGERCCLQGALHVRCLKGDWQPLGLISCLSSLLPKGKVVVFHQPKKMSCQLYRDKLLKRVLNEKKNLSPVV